MQIRRRASVRSQVIFAGIIAMVGAALPALPAVANETPVPVPSAAPRTMSTESSVLPTDQFIVKFKDRASIQSLDRKSSLNRAAGTLGVPIEAVRTLATGEEVVKTDKKLGGEEAGELVSALAADPSVEYAEPDVIMRPFASAPNDPLYSYQWAHSSTDSGGMRVLGAWDVSQGAGSVVAVIDTGITDHTDLNANILPGFDMIHDPLVAGDSNGRDSNPADEGDATYYGECEPGWPGYSSSWHGTHVAGLVAAVAGNSKGVAGVAPKAKVVPVRALGICGGYASDIADSIVWAAGGTVTGAPANANPANVINLSLGGLAPCSTIYQNAADFARSKGASVVVAAGNEGIDASKVSPANCKNVLVVGASTRNGLKASYSNFGINVDVAAPGGDMTNSGLDGILSTLNDGTDSLGSEGYSVMEGSSMAAPQVAAVAAMMYSKLPALTPADVEQRLKASARPINGCGCGAGLVDANATLTKVAAEAAPITAGIPTISGEAAVGKLLIAEPGNWGNTYEATWNYQWNRWGTPIPGATGNGYWLTEDDHQATITVTVTATKKFVPAVSATSEPTVQVAPGTLFGSVPVITGSAYEGSTLTANPGTWGPAPVDLTYRWTRNKPGTTGEHVSSASTYTLTSEDIGSTLSLHVMGNKTPYWLLEMSSKPTPVVVAADKAVTPEAVVFTEAPYMGNDRYTIPESETMDYQVDDKMLQAGTHPARGQAKITAVPKSGYAVLNGATSEWKAYFSAKGPEFTAPAVSPFRDVATTQQFYKEMSWLADRKISTGWVEADKSVSYRPVTPINRDAMAAFLYRAAGSPDYTPPAQSPFKDVATTQQFYKEMAWLAETGISSGWTENGARYYKPLTPIKRDAMAAFLYRLVNKPDYEAPMNPPFKDLDSGQLFYKEMVWMSVAGISSGWQLGENNYWYQPMEPINRDAMAAFLYRLP
ncbi:S8 family serine peptidase [Paenarthrobacter aurescens]|uniref:Serine protease, subtilase family n=1 Tax=Paenarthrobacter aurescens (strain TC1) TaxID=290340 RepID=A1R9B4_PAEAT|nr:S8 family peptidase [Paenarthrobacter aurescens]ABM07416.1 putative serine protease, subtilase family [Paenarthrobacter aurescens TC1]